MSSERAQNKVVMRALKGCDPVRVENPAHPGTPDINCIHGWVEDKCLSKWPKNANESPVKIDHFTPQQRVWLRRRHETDGRAWLLLKVKREWLLFDGTTAAEIVGRATRTVLEKRCRRHWKEGLHPKELRECLALAN